MPIRKDDWLVLGRDDAVHHWAVSVPLHQCIISLLGCTPLDAKFMVVRHRPFKLVESVERALRIVEVHKGVPESLLAAEVDWQIDEIVPAAEACIVEDMHQLELREMGWDVPHSNRRSHWLRHWPEKKTSTENPGRWRDAISRLAVR